MAGWSMLTNGSSLDCSDVTNEINGTSSCCSDVNHSVKDCNPVDESNDDNEEKLRGLFDQVLSVFVSDAGARGCIRPVPALLGDERSLDLFELFRVVRKRGGFDLVNGFWSFVAKELGLDLGASASVKLVYFKYLYEFERWLRGRSAYGRFGNVQRQPGESFSSLSMELEAEFRGLLSNVHNKEKDGKHKKKNKKCIDMYVVKSKIGTPDTKDAHIGHYVVGSKCTDDDEKFRDYKDRHIGKAVDISTHPPSAPTLADKRFTSQVKPYEKTSSNYNDDDDVVLVLKPSEVDKLFSSRKRKRESLSGMLNWVIQIAKYPDHPSTADNPQMLKWKDHKGNEFWAQAIRARNALVRRRQINSFPEQSLIQSNQKMHPAMYDDATPTSDPCTERLRCSGRLPSIVKPRSCSCCNSSSAPNAQLISPRKTGLSDTPEEKLLVADDFSATTSMDSPSGEEIMHKHVSIGPRFQAEVPEWTGLVSESDSKLLGTRVWPEKCRMNIPAVETDSIGKGRPDLCECELPGSVECVRFHIAENRLKLKKELGPVFYHWKFDSMGEEISLRWSSKEEKRYKDVVKFNLPSLDRFFWDKSLKYFPRKTKEELVSYYFNVFLVQRRSYQNRVTPKHIDSDDDESEFGSLSDRYGLRVVTIPGSMLTCSENKQCTDFS